MRFHAPNIGKEATVRSCSSHQFLSSVQIQQDLRHPSKKWSEPLDKLIQGHPQHCLGQGPKAAARLEPEGKPAALLGYDRGFKRGQRWRGKETVQKDRRERRWNHLSRADVANSAGKSEEWDWARVLRNKAVCCPGSFPRLQQSLPATGNLMVGLWKYLIFKVLLCSHYALFFHYKKCIREWLWNQANKLINFPSSLAEF